MHAPAAPAPCTIRPAAADHDADCILLICLLLAVKKISRSMDKLFAALVSLLAVTGTSSHPKLLVLINMVLHKYVLHAIIEASDGR